MRSNPGSRRSTQVGALLTAALLVAVMLNAVQVNPAASQTLVLQSAAVDRDPGSDPNAKAWDQANAITVPLTGQLVTYPRGGGTVPSATVRALHTKKRLYVRIDWSDTTRDDRAAASDFSDAVAVQFPVKGTISIPSICMGQADAAVNIWYWKAVLEGKGLPPLYQVYPHMHTDLDLFSLSDPDAPDIAYPARYVGNPASGVRASPVQALTARAFGTLSPTASQSVEGKGVWQDGRWSVVFVRDFNVEAPDEAALSLGTKTDMAVAVWDGSRGERNGQKSVSQFIRLTIPAAAPTGPFGGLPALTLVYIGIVVLSALIGVFIGWISGFAPRGSTA